MRENECERLKSQIAHKLLLEVSRNVVHLQSESPIHANEHNCAIGAMCNEEIQDCKTIISLPEYHEHVMTRVRSA